MSDETAIQVNFGRPLPLFPLDSVSLLPQQVLPVHIFEPRYRQMIEHSLDGAGQIAMCIFSGNAWKENYHGRPPLRRAVCIGQIVQHERLEDGRFNILMQGVCRAKLVRELPASEDRLYRVGMLEPVGLDYAGHEDLSHVRDEIGKLLIAGGLSKFSTARPVLEWLNNEEIPSAVLLELVTFAMITEPKLRYKLLAEPDAGVRSSLILAELEHLDRMVIQAKAQQPEDWPKGCSWN